MSLVPERWEQLFKGIDPETGLPVAYVAREKRDGETRLTVWKLVRRPNGWYNVGQWLSIGRFRVQDLKRNFARNVPPYKRPLKLSTSQLDLKLRELAEA